MATRTSAPKKPGWFQQVGLVGAICTVALGVVLVLRGHSPSHPVALAADGDLDDRPPLHRPGDG